MKRYETWKNVKQRGGKNKVSKAMWKCRRGREKRGKKCRDGIKKMSASDIKMIQRGKYHKHQQFIKEDKQNLPLCQQERG